MKKDTTKNIIAIVLALITTIFIWHKFLISGNTVLLITLIPVFYYFFKKVIENENKRKFTISIIIGVIFSIIELICSSINTDYTLNNVIDKWLILNFLGYTIIFWSTVSIVISIIENNKLSTKHLKIGKLELLTDSKTSFFVNMFLIFIAWIPYFLRYYPGLLTADSCAQVAQAIGLTELTNHHPILHTGIISIFVNLGRGLFNNINTGVAMYTLFQMIAMSAMFSIVLKYMSKRNTPLVLRIITLLYYMFYPINALFGITMWKDILFAGIIPIYILYTMEFVFNTEKFLENKKTIVFYIIISILVMFLRNNGLYVVVLTLPFLIVALRKHWKEVIVISCLILVMYFSLKTIVFNVLNIKEGSVGEMLSIPLQQIARVKKYHKEELSNEQLQEINQFFNCDNIEEKYNPILSDPVKAELNNQYFEENKGEFIKLWLGLLRNYFKDYVESFISNSYGYYYPEATHWVANRTMEPNSMGIEQTPIIESGLVSKINSVIERRDIPVISMFFSIGMAFWLIVISFGYEIYKKQYKSIVTYIIIFILWLTIVASPVFCEYRYAYPMFTALPLYISLNFVKKDNKIEKN